MKHALGNYWHVWSHVVLTLVVSLLFMPMLWDDYVFRLWAKLMVRLVGGSKTARQIESLSEEP